MRATETQDRGLDCFPRSLALNGRARNPGFWLRHHASWSSQEPYSSNLCFCAINPWVNQILLDRQTCSFYPQDVRSLIPTPLDWYHLSCELTDSTCFLWQESERVAEGLLVIKSSLQACMKECSCLCLERVSDWEKEGDPGEVDEIWLSLFLLTLRWPCCDISRDLWGLSQVIPNPQSLIQERVCLNFVTVAPKVTIWAFAADLISGICWADLDKISTLCARLLSVLYCRHVIQCVSGHYSAGFTLSLDKKDPQRYQRDNAGLFLELFLFSITLQWRSKTFKVQVSFMRTSSGLPSTWGHKCKIWISSISQVTWNVQKKEWQIKKEASFLVHSEEQGAMECILERPGSSSSLLYHGDQL